MRILVTGDRNWRNAVVLRDALTTVMSDLAQELDETYHRFTIIHGDARGADTIADIVVQLLQDQDYEFYGIGKPEDPVRYPADWTANGRAAGPIRNQEMLDGGVDYVVGFHNDIVNSKGTKDMLKRCAEANIPGRLFMETGEYENWQSLVT